MPNLLCPTYGQPPQGTYEVGVPFNSGNTWNFNTNNGLNASYPAVGPVFSTTPGFENISYSYPGGTLNSSLTLLTLTFSGTPERAGYADFTLTLLDATPCVFSLWVGCTDLTTADTLGSVTYGTVTFDQATYPTIGIGNQIWLASNLIETFGDPGIEYVGDNPNGSDDTLWASKTTGAYTNYNAWTEALNCVYGYLYNWYALANINNFLSLINSPYIVPSNSDFTTLRNYVGSIAPVGARGGKLKSNTPSPFAEWNSPNTGATNLTGFSALPAGTRVATNGSYTNRGTAGNFWTTDSNPTTGFGFFYSLIASDSNDYIGFSSDKRQGFSVRLVIPPVLVTVTIVNSGGTGSVATTGAASSLTSSGTSSYTILLRYDELVNFVVTPSGGSTVSFALTSGPGSISGSGNNYSYSNLTEPIGVTVTFSAIPGCNPCTFSRLNTVDYTYGSVTVNSVCYPTLQIGSLEVTTYNLTIRDITTLFPGVTFIGPATPNPATVWTNAGSNDAAVCAFTSFANNSLLASTDEDTCAKGLLFNHHAIAQINSYLATFNPGWRVLTECDAKHIKNRVSIDLSVGCPAGGLGVGAISILANGLTGNASDECLQNDDFNPAGLGATLMSVGGTTNNALANNDSGYTLVRTGFVETNGTFGGGQNANIWTSTSADKQYYNGTTTVYTSDDAWRGFAVDMDTGGETYVDHIPNVLSRGFAVRLCRTVLTPYDFTGNQNVALDTGVLVVGTPISGATSTINYTNSYGTWRINKCRDIVNNITATAGRNDIAPGWDKLNGTTANPGSGQIVVTFSGIPATSGTFTWTLPIGCDTISITRTVSDPGPSISTLNCTGANASLTETIVDGFAVSPGTTFTVTYTGGNGQSYPSQSFNSTGVTGLTATIAAGTLASGNGSLTFTVTGTPSGSGTAQFPITFAGATCSANITVAPDIGTVTGISGCTNPPLVNGPIVANTAVSPGTTFSINYTGGNGLFFSPQTVSSTGVTGLTASFSGGYLPSGSGSFTFTITGTPVGNGTASFAVSFAAQGGGTVTCTVTIPVEPDGPSITSLICTPINLVGGPLLEGIAISGASFTIAYSGGNGLPYSGQTITSTGVGGITATLSAGTLANGNGQLTYNLSGTPLDNGTAAFAISFPNSTGGTVTCTVTVPVTPVVLLSYLGCDNATYSPTSPPFNVGVPLSTDISIPYTSTQGGLLAQITVVSTGVTGLTLTLDSTTVLDNATGTFSGSISGTPNQSGNAVFTVCVGGYLGQGQTCCTLIIPIQVPPPSIGTIDCANAVYIGQVQYPGSYAVSSNVTITIPYTGGNGQPHPSFSFASTGVTGLIMSTPAGTLAGSSTTPQSGNFTFNIIGTPSGIGDAVFNVNILGQTCEILLPVTQIPGDITGLDCTAATTSAPILSGQSVNGITLSVPYTGGNGGVYNTQILQSTPPGVSAYLGGSSLAVGSGTLQLSLSGTMPAGFVPITFQFSFPEGSPPCTITLTPPIEPGTAVLDCNSEVVVGTITYPDPIPVNNPVILYVNYNGSNGGSYPAATYPSSIAGVTGLTAALPAGQFALGFGTLELTITGTPQSSGIAYFDVTIGGSTCTLEVVVEAPIGVIDQLNCNPSSIVVTGNLVNGQVASGVTFTVPYAGSNGGTYPANTAASLNIVTGLTATLAPGIFNEPNGTVTYTVTGTPLGAGNATFPITVANQSCTVLLIVDPIPGTADLDCANATFSTTPVQGFSTFVTGNIPYTNGNGGFYEANTYTTDGLILTINSGYFNNGSGSVPFTIQGTAAVSGTITFTNIEVGDQTCNLTITVSEPPPIIDDLLCDQAVITGSLIINQPAGVTITIPYNGSNEQPYPQDSSNSTGITGLTATTPAGVLTDPTGQLIYTVTGTPTASGVATFTITIGTQTCVISIPVSPPNFFGPETPSPCQEVTYTDPGCEVLTDTCTILFNGTEVIYSTISTTNPCQVSFQVPCDTAPNSLAEVTFLDCDDNIITTESLPIGDTLPSYLSQTSGCPGDQVTLLDTGCIFANDVTNIQVCYPGSTGCVSIGPGTLLNSSLPLPCSIAFTIPVPSPAPFYPVDVQVVFEGSSGVLKEFDFTVQDCEDGQNSFDPEEGALPGDEVTFTNPDCDLVTPDLTELLIDGVPATIVSIGSAPDCTVTFIIPDGVGPGEVTIEFIDDLGNVIGTEPYTIGSAGGDDGIYTVTFTPQVEGCHRIYFRTTEEEYCYYQADGPFEVGVPVTITINLADYADCLVTVPPVGCDDSVRVTGYIQPCCTPSDSTDNIVELNFVEFNLSPCGLYSVVCNSSNCGSFTKSNCFASGCTGINDLTEYAFRGNAGIPGNTVYVCSEGNGVQNTPNSTYTITKLSTANATIYGDNVLADYPFGPTYWTDGGSADWDTSGFCGLFVGDSLYVPENSSNGVSTSFASILTIGSIYEFSFMSYSNVPTTITFGSGIGNTVPVSCPGNVVCSGNFVTYQITAQSNKLNIVIPSVDGGTCFQLLSLRQITTGVKATCCSCFGAQVQIEFLEEGPTSIEVYYTQCTDDGPQIATATLTDAISAVNCCTYGSIFPVNKFDIQYITSIVYTDTPAC